MSANQPIIQRAPVPLDLGSTKPFDKLQLLEIGKEKSGKSWCAATAPEPVLFNDFDLRAASLGGKKNVYSLSYQDPAPHIQPYAFNQLLDVTTKLEQGADLRDLGFANVDKGVRPATIVDDSVTTIARSASRYALYSNADIRRRLAFGSWTVDFAKNFDAWNAEMSTVEALILRHLALPFHFIATLHEMEEETEDSSVEKKKFTGRVGPFPARYSLLFKYFNEVWHFDNAPSLTNPAQPIYESRAQIKPDARCPWAVTTLNVGAKQFVKPNIKELIAVHVANSPK